MYTRWKVTTALVSKNLISLLYYNKTQNCCMRKRESDKQGTTRIYTISSGWDKSSDMHHVEINIQTALLLHASFMEAWYCAALQPRGHCSHLRVSAHNSITVDFLEFKTSVSIYFLNVNIFFLPALHLHNSHGISAVPCLPQNTAAHPVLKSTLTNLSKVNM